MVPVKDKLEQYDYVVIGVGGIGSGTLYWLSKLTNNSIFRWRELERDSGEEVFFPCGNLTITTRDTGLFPLMTQLEANMVTAGYPHQVFDGKQLEKKWPQFQFGHKDVLGILDPSGGLLDPIVANAAHRKCARDRGVHIMDRTKVTLVTKYQPGYLVETTRGNFLAHKVIVTSGAWVNSALQGIDVHVPVKVTQENVTYIASRQPEEFTKEKSDNFIRNRNDVVEIIYNSRIPTFYCMEEKGNFYSIPSHNNSGFKIGMHGAGPATTGDDRTFTKDPVRESTALDFIKTYLPQAFGPVIETKTCLYTLTKDGKFVVDTLASRGHPNVMVCIDAGTGYKFAGLFGKILSQLATKGTTEYEIGDFSANRSEAKGRFHDPRSKL